MTQIHHCFQIQRWKQPGSKISSIISICGFAHYNGQDIKGKVCLCVCTLCVCVYVSVSVMGGRAADSKVRSLTSLPCWSLTDRISYQQVVYLAGPPRCLSGVRPERDPWQPSPRPPATCSAFVPLSRMRSRWMMDWLLVMNLNSFATVNGLCAAEELQETCYGPCSTN